VQAGSLSSNYVVTTAVAPAPAAGAVSGTSGNNLGAIGSTSLNAPANFKVALSASPFGVHLSWTYEQTPTGFEVYRAQGAQDIQKIQNVPIAFGQTNYEFTDIHVAHSTTYSYKVCAVSPGLQSPYTPVLTITLPA